MHYCSQHAAHFPPRVAGPGVLFCSMRWGSQSVSRGGKGTVAFCLAFIYAGLGFALGFLFFFLFCTGCLSCCLHTHTQGHSNRFRFLFIYTLSCLPWQLVFQQQQRCPSPLCLPAYLPAVLPIFLYTIYFFFLLLAPFTFAVVSAFSCSVRALFVYASFWFSQLKLYLLFLFSLVIPGTVSWIWVLLLQDWESALVSRLPFFSALYTFCVFVLLVESSPAKFICVLVYTFSFSSSFLFLLCYV